ncbi:MAG TPA: GvpL/GvpF family gas vesicle protein [Streptosporangiaceae bacterium]|nr:GvpL/GvpF family gas vesicle protein [Streptosporangiaceae bacterium]
MPASTREESRRDTEQQTGWYVYGVVPGDVKLNSGVHGVGDPPGEIRLVRSGDLAALVSEVDVTRPLGTPEDLQAHQEILDAVVSEAPVLPFRFGGVLASEDAVVEELLETNHDEFAAALAELEGRAEYVIRGRYDEQAILEEILAGNSTAARLGDRIRGADPDATRDLRIQLGEIVNNAVADTRQADTRVLLTAMEDHCAASVVRTATNELDAMYVAFLIEDGKTGELEDVVRDLSDRWPGRVHLSIRGPMAPYDFVGTMGEGQG